jgi:2-polyprenyl-3-methyl-5-hydroxy-6-metoxy-1,4-benzoquinol methylase
MKCLGCKDNIVNFFDLGKIPPSDYFAETANKAKNAPLFKLTIGSCVNCSLVQNRYLVPANLRYKKLKYFYNSANSNYAKKHWKSYVNMISKFLKRNSKFLDIGCNDGYLLNLVQKKTQSNYIYGLDASDYQVNQSRKKYKKINFYCDYAENSGKVFKKNFFDIITINNVFNHSSKPLLFLREIKKILNDDGIIFIEVPNWIETIQKKKWDQLYHEHITYFTPYTIVQILNQVGFKVLKLDNIEFHGGSLRVVANKSKGFIDDKKKFQNISLRKCKQLANHAETIRIKINKKVNSIKSIPIYLFGSPAKGNTLINYFGLNHESIAACIETSKDKIGKFMSKSVIPIIAQNKFKKKGVYIINLCWNIPFVFKNFCTKFKLKIIKI